MKPRFYEIDAVRGFAVVLMACFHAAMIGDIVSLWSFDWGAPLWIFWGHVVRMMFWWVFGVSVALSSRGMAGQFVRALHLLGGGLLASAATYFVFGDDFVRFGILQFLAVAAPFTRLFKGRLWVGFFASIALIFSFSWAHFLDAWLYSPWDYVSVSWLAVPIWGLIWGEWVYGARENPLIAFRVRPLEFLGRHALAFYLLHFPILYFSLLGLSKLIS